MPKATRRGTQAELHQLVLAAAMLARKLLADDLGHLAAHDEARDAVALSLMAHRLQLVEHAVRRLSP